MGPHGPPGAVGPGNNSQLSHPVNGPVHTIQFHMSLKIILKILFSGRLTGWEFDGGDDFVALAKFDDVIHGFCVDDGKPAVDKTHCQRTPVRVKIQAPPSGGNIKK